MKRYKFLRKGNKSENGNFKWKLGEWYIHEGEIEMCNAGFHCSRGIYQAFNYVQGEILAEVEVKGKHQTQNDKEVWEKMRVVKEWKWTKKDSVLFSIYSAYLCLDNFEKVYPNDKRAREAIEAAERYIENPTEKNQEAAESAGSAGSAAWSAWSARSAAESAAWSARSAAESAAWPAAESAAESAAWSARSAGSAAESAAWSARSAAESAVYKKLDKWMLNHLKELKQL
jgi:hypothetical protein